MIGTYNGFLIGLLVTDFELHSRRAAGQNWHDRAPFLVNVLLRSALYLAVFTLVIRSGFLVVGIRFDGWGWREADFLIAVGASFAASIAFDAIRMDLDIWMAAKRTSPWRRRPTRGRQGPRRMRCQGLRPPTPG